MSSLCIFSEGIDFLGPSILPLCPAITVEIVPLFIFPAWIEGPVNLPLTEGKAGTAVMALHLVKVVSLILSHNRGSVLAITGSTGRGTKHFHGPSHLGEAVLGVLAINLDLNPV